MKKTLSLFILSLTFSKIYSMQDGIYNKNEMAIKLKELGIKAHSKEFNIESIESLKFSPKKNMLL